MKVSILVPIYGVEKYIERCAISLFEQTYENIEYIFVNDCTKDDSINILKNVLNRYPLRKEQTRILEHKRNKGLGEARNTAVAAATGDFLMHVDSDDYIDQTCVAKCVKKQIETGADVVSFDAICERPHYTELVNITNAFSKEENVINMIRGLIPHVIWGRFIRTSLYALNNIKVEGECGMGEDAQVIPRLIYCSKIIANLHEYLYFYNCLNSDSYTFSFSSSKSKQVLYAMDVLRKFFQTKGQQYVDAVNFGEVRTLSEQIVKSVKDSPVDKAYYLQLRSHFKACSKGYLQNLSLPYRLGFIITNYYGFVFYVRFSSFVKDIIKRLKHRTLKKKYR